MNACWKRSLAVSLPWIVLTVCPCNAQQFEADKLVAPRSQQERGHWFGYSVAMSGDWALVGDYVGTGHAHFFHRVPNEGWEHAQTVHGDGVSSVFGLSVDIDGAVAVVGAPEESAHGHWRGRSYVYERAASGAWGLVDELVPSEVQDGHFSGTQVAVSGNTIVLSSAGSDDPVTNGGSITVFERQGRGWEQVFRGVLPDLPIVLDGKMKNLGRSVAIDGDVIVAGATGLSGAAFVYERGPAGWQRAGMLEDPSPGTADNFGHSVAVHGDTLVVGESGPWSGGFRPGSAFLFERSATGVWTLVQEVQASDGYANGERGDHFGTSVAVQDDVVVVGMPNSQAGGYLSGGAYVFRRGPQGWPVLETQKLLAKDPVASERAGQSVAIAGSFCAVGAPGHQGAGPRGAAYAFGIEQGTILCPGALNSTGEPAHLTIAGSARVGDRRLTLLAKSIPLGAPARFWVDSTFSDDAGTVGESCLGWTRLLLHRDARFGVGGLAVFQELDFEDPWVRNHLLAGTTWYFQLEYLDAALGSRLHSNVVELTLE